jgi:predicted nucleotidyltransferase
MEATDLLQRDSALAALVRRVVELFRPERVYLFGSKARGDDGPDSDYDLLVVVPDDAEPERLDSRRFYKYEDCRDLPRRVDVVIWRATKFVNRSRVVASLPATVLREGKLLYAA